MAKWWRNDATAARRTVTIYLYLADGVTPVPLATTFVAGDLKIRSSGGAYANVAGSFTNVGVDGEWEYQATQAETNVTASEIVLRFAKTSYATRAMVIELDNSYEVDPSIHQDASTTGEQLFQPAATVAAGTNGKTTFSSSLTGYPVNHFKNQWLRFMKTATAAGESQQIASNDGSGNITLVTALTLTPVNGDPFILIGK